MRHDHLHADASRGSVSAGRAWLAACRGRPARWRSISCRVDRRCRPARTCRTSRAAAWSSTDGARPYQPGDDPRNIDWRVTARSSEAYTKLFREERERPVLIAVDLRSNMHFATRGSCKSVCASRAAALLSWSAHHRGDRLGGIIFGDEAHRELKPRLGRQAALRYVHQLVTHGDWQHTTQAPDFDPGLPLTAAMSALRRVTRPGSLVVVISDFQGFGRAAQSYLAGIARHNEVLAIHVSDPLERQLPPPGHYRLVCDDREMDIDTYARAAREAYSAAWTERRAALETFCQALLHALSMPLSTEDDPVACLQQALGRRTH
ncbi:MAG: DUF58 domain-containing protein [Woeseiaceae bacterium]|nr:DUF58 domain-containing protein [Woeseiaceae bacterium]